MPNSPSGPGLVYDNSPQPVLILASENWGDFDHSHLELKPREWPRYIFYLILCTSSFLLMIGSALCFAFIVHNNWFSTTTEDDTPVNPDCAFRTNEWYYHSDWFIPLPGFRCDCATPAPITTVHVDVLQVSRGQCSDTLSCLTVISFFLTLCKDWQHCRYTFFVDMKMGVYSARDWGCPVASGELWVAILDTPNGTDPMDHGGIRRILTHFHSDITEYAIHCNFFTHSGLEVIYPNTTIPVSHDRCPFLNGNDSTLSH